MTTGCSSISRFSTRIFVWIINNIINIFWSNISNWFANRNYISNIYNKIRGNMAIWYYKRIWFCYYGISTSAFKANKSYFTSNNRINCSSFCCRNIYSRMIWRCPRCRWFARTKFWCNCVKTRSWPKICIIWKNIVFISLRWIR